MADKSFGIRQLNLIGGSGTANITSPNNLNLNASNVAISTDVTVGRHLDVDGHAEFDAVNVAGVSTFAGITTVSGPSLFTNQLSVSGVSTFLSAINVSSSYGTSGQVLTSQGSGSAPQWATLSGGLLQTKQTLLTATNSFSTSSTGAWFDIPSLTVNITTTQANSKIILNAFVYGEHTDQEPDKSFRLVRTIGGSSTNIPDNGSGSRPGVWNTMVPGWVSASTGSTGSGTPMNNLIDEPAQSSGTTITYKVQVWSINTGSTFFLNRTVNDTDNGGHERGISYISLMEVAV